MHNINNCNHFDNYSLKLAQRGTLSFMLSASVQWVAPASLGVSSGNAVMCWACADVAVVVVMGLANVFYSVSRSLQSRPIRGVCLCREYWPMRGFLYQTINYEPLVTSRWQIFGRYSRFQQHRVNFYLICTPQSGCIMHIKQPLKALKVFPVIKLMSNYPYYVDRVISWLNGFLVFIHIFFYLQGC